MSVIALGTARAGEAPSARLFVPRGIQNLSVTGLFSRKRGDSGAAEATGPGALAAGLAHACLPRPRKRTSSTQAGWVGRGAETALAIEVAGTGFPANCDTGGWLASARQQEESWNEREV